jgi:WD40 repeat protein
VTILKKENSTTWIPHLVFSAHSYTRCFCAFSDSILTAGNFNSGIKKWILKDLTNQITQGTSLVHFENEWIMSITNIKNEYFGYSGKYGNYFIQHYSSNKIEKTFKDGSLKRILCSAYDESEYLYIGTFDGNLIIIDCLNWRIHQILKFESSISWILPLQNGCLGISFYDGNIKILDQRNDYKVMLTLMHGELSKVNHLCFISKFHFASCHDDGSLKIWNVSSCRIAQHILSILKGKRLTDVYFRFKNPLQTFRIGNYYWIDES